MKSLRLASLGRDRRRLSRGPDVSLRGQVCIREQWSWVRLRGFRLDYVVSVYATPGQPQISMVFSSHVTFKAWRRDIAAVIHCQQDRIHPGPIRRKISGAITCERATPLQNENQALPRRLRRSAFSARSFSESSLRSCLFSSSSLMRSAISSMPPTGVATGAEAAAPTRGLRVAAVFGAAAAFSALTGAVLEPRFARVFLPGFSTGAAVASTVLASATAFGVRGLRVFFSAGTAAGASVVAVVSIVFSSAISVLLCQAGKHLIRRHLKSMWRAVFSRAIGA